MSHQHALSSVTAHDAQTRTQALPSSSPTTATQSNSSAPSPTLNEHRVSSVSNSNSMCVAEMDQKNSSDRRIGPTLRIVRTPSTDGYNWRKYGQKQVKIPQGSRSYYKCTYSECYAKKIECCDHSNCVIEMIYKGQHNHEPPRKVNYARESGLSLSVVEGNISNLATSLKEPKQEVHETNRQNSSGSDGNAEVIAKEQHVDEPEPKRRQVTLLSCWAILTHSPLFSPFLHSYRESVRVLNTRGKSSFTLSIGGKLKKNLSFLSSYWQWEVLISSLLLHFPLFG